MGSHRHREEGHNAGTMGLLDIDRFGSPRDGGNVSIGRAVGLRVIVGPERRGELNAELVLLSRHYTSADHGWVCGRGAPRSGGLR